MYWVFFPVLFRLPISFSSIFFKRFHISPCHCFLDLSLLLFFKDLATYTFRVILSSIILSVWLNYQSWGFLLYNLWLWFSYPALYVSFFIVSMIVALSNICKNLILVALIFHSLFSEIVHKSKPHVIMKTTTFLNISGLFTFAISLLFRNARSILLANVATAIVLLIIYF